MKKQYYIFLLLIFSSSFSNAWTHSTIGFTSCAPNEAPAWIILTSPILVNADGKSAIQYCASYSKPFNGDYTHTITTWATNTFTNDAVCPTGTALNTATGNCDLSCASGTASDRTVNDIILNIPASCRSPADRCSYRKQQTPAFSDVNLKSAVDSCVTVCSINATGPWPVTCSFTGIAYNFGTGNGTQNVPGTPTLAPPPELTQPAPNASCPANTDQGTVNGVRYCAPRTNSSGQPNTSPSLTSTSSEITTTQTSTSTNPDGSISTTTISSTVNGSGNNSGSGNGTGSGPCDPTATNYAECINMGEAVKGGVIAAGGGGGGDGEGGPCDPKSTDYLQCLAGTGSDYGDFGTGDKTLNSVSDTFYSGLQQSNVGQMASSISGGLPQGQCPTVIFDMFSRTYTMNQWCTLYESNSGEIALVARICWIFMGIVIILGA